MENQPALIRTEKSTALKDVLVRSQSFWKCHVPYLLPTRQEKIRYQNSLIKKTSVWRYLSCKNRQRTWGARAPAPQCCHFFVLLYKAQSSFVTHEQSGLMTNTEKTGGDFTCIEERRISHAQVVKKVYEGKHDHMSQQCESDTLPL